MSRMHISIVGWDGKRKRKKAKRVRRKRRNKIESGMVEHGRPNHLYIKYPGKIYANENKKLFVFKFIFTVGKRFVT